MVNAHKTQFSVFCRKNKFIPDELNTLSINGINIQRSPHVKYLGVIVDDKLNWHPQIYELEKRLIKTVKAFKLIKKKLAIKENKV